MDKIRVGLIEDHNVLRQSLKKALNMEFDLEVIGSWNRAEPAVENFEKFKCDVYVMDLKLPGMNGIEATKRLKRLDPAVNVIILSAYSDDTDIFNSISAGVLGYLPKDVTLETLVAAVRQVYRGYAFLDPSITRQVLDKFSTLEKYSNSEEELSDMEMKILSLASKGTTNKEIGKILNIKHGAVKFHLREVFKKLGANDRAHAVALALKKKLL